MEKYLSRIKKIDTLISNKKNEYKRLKDIAYGLGGYSEGERVMSSKTYDKSANAICHYVDIEKEIDKLESERAAIIDNINSLPSDECKIIYKLYVQYEQDYTLKELSYEFKRSYAWVKKKKKKAMNLLKKMVEG
jgi:DNA-directed RNA polymerase sigma subunit (sigma70/sigma32)